MKPAAAFFAHIGDDVTKISQFTPKLISGIETDVRMTKDGVVVIRHDRRIKVAYNRNMWIDRMKYDDIEQLCDDHPITLVQFINQIKKRFPKKKSLTLDIDVKQYNIEIALYAVLKQTKAFSHFSNIIISSPDAWVLQRYFDLDHRLLLALTDAPLDKWDLWDLKAYRYLVQMLVYTLRPLTLRLTRKKSNGYHMPIFNICSRIVDKKMVDFLHDQNIRVHVYDVHDTHQANALTALGVDVIKVKNQELIEN